MKLMNTNGKTQYSCHKTAQQTERQPYPTDLTANEWEEISQLLIRTEGAGRKRAVEEREVINAILYLWHGGSTWRMLPHDFPPWSTVYYYYRRWRQDGTLAEVRECLRQMRRQVAW